MSPYWLLIAILSCFGCSDSNEPPIRTLPVPNNLETNCKNPTILIKSFNKTPNQDQRVNQSPGTRITKATIDCKNFQINIIAQYDSSAFEDELLIINYGKKSIELVRGRGDSAGGGYLNFLGVDDRFIYYSITGAKIVADGVVQTHYCFNWKTGEEHFLDYDSCNTFQ
ncbi:hypothetical protein LEP1GSC060_3101 [Leptospira weilii serovar Ranarum str. ICFT]|uniref:Uncharacterized protein n=1 Tax=Leptospira weilii serovar Ranarum str. ICFT TaxID=1218598 RepID=N1WJW6_9LEPT|nr:hypothetical protein [Leptospira weilii]EMY77409.1 hypothetical protein LEP1GSC060_3101 [Leptospira weilii serovar Ranarum str. ICFT]